MLDSDIYRKHLLKSWGFSFPILVYDKYCNHTALLSECFSVASENLNFEIKTLLTEKERNAFQALYMNLPQILTDMIGELNCLLELRSQMVLFPADTSTQTVKNAFGKLKRPGFKGGRFTERGEQLLNKIEKPLSMELRNQLLSFDSSFMSNDQLRLDFFICVMRQVWSSPKKQTALPGLLARLGIKESDAISTDRMFPYFVYHQIAICSIIMSTDSQYRISFLRIPLRANYEFIFTDNPVIDFCGESKLSETHDNNRFLWVISPTLAVMISNNADGESRFVTEEEVVRYNALLFKKATRYVVLNKDHDFLPSCS